MESFRYPSSTRFFSFSSILAIRKPWKIGYAGPSWYRQLYFWSTYGIFLGTPRYIILRPPRKIRQEVPYGNNADDCPCFSHRKVPHTKLPHFILRIQKSLGGVDAI